jgi:hypothetical protein
MTKNSSRVMACALALSLLSMMAIEGVQSQLAYNAMKDKVRPRFGGPSMAQQVEYVQNAVNVMEDYIRYKSVDGNEGAPDGKRFNA